MKVFASWSGSESREVAELLRDWVPSVIQDVEVYVSSQDIAKGERWLSNVGNNLAEIDFGIVVVTKKNLTAPWIMFEAGALSKSVKGRLIPLLCGIDQIETANSPLSQFQYVRVIETEMLDMFRSINPFTANPLDAKRLEKTFAKFWPDFLDAYKQIDLSEPKPAKKESENEKLSNIENAVSEMMIEMRRLRSLTSDFVPSTINPDEKQVWNWLINTKIDNAERTATLNKLRLMNSPAYRNELLKRKHGKPPEDE